MCIIVVKQTPTITEQQWKQLHNCFDNNHEGVGMMWRNRKGKVVVSKGYMEWQEFEDAVVKLHLEKVNPVVFHFRFATHGSISPGNCHPFPISRKIRDLQALELKSDAAVVHNGILNVTIPQGSKLSDTQVFVRDVLSQTPDDILEHPAYQLLLATTGSKFVFLMSRALYKVGEFFEDAGWLFSNNGYKRVYTYDVASCVLCQATTGVVWYEKWHCCVCKDCAQQFDLVTSPVAPTKHQPYYSVTDDEREEWLQTL